MNVFDILREKFETKKVAAIQNQKHFNDKDLEETALVCEAISAAFDSAIKTVNLVEQEYNNGWIPVSERFPIGKETHKVLVTDKDGIMAVCYFLEVTKVFKVTWMEKSFKVLSHGNHYHQDMSQRENRAWEIQLNLFQKKIDVNFVAKKRPCYVICLVCRW